MEQWQSWLFILGAAFNTSVANILVKESRLHPRGPGLFGLLFSPWFVGGLAFYGISLLLFAKALERLPVSMAYPAQAGLSFALLITFSCLFLGEQFTLLKISGIAIILVGMFIVVR
jgi:multidrug transporter EmrE-like cation transporter